VNVSVAEFVGEVFGFADRLGVGGADAPSAIAAKPTATKRTPSKVTIFAALLAVLSRVTWLLNESSDG
jgi:hypothetical protein